MTCPVCPQIRAQLAPALPCLLPYCCLGWLESNQQAAPTRGQPEQSAQVCQSAEKKLKTHLRSATALVSQGTPADGVACGKASKPHPQGNPPPSMAPAFFPQPSRRPEHRASPRFCCLLHGSCLDASGSGDTGPEPRYLIATCPNGHRHVRDHWQRLLASKVTGSANVGTLA